MKLNNFDKIQKIQKILKTTPFKIELPSIIVLGSQSSGKSSVLERIINADILPKDFKIATKCPIEINMRKTEGKEYVLIDNINYSISKAKTIIQEKMNLLCHKSQISSTPIQIEIFSNNCLEITLIDLPGLTKIPLKDQPLDIENQILEITMKYINNDNCILLPVIPANSDISTAEVLKLCRMADPHGKRTLGILTKIDLMDAGTDCLDILENKLASLELGYIGIINRGHNELKKNFTLKNIEDKEKEFFENHEKYKKIWPNIGIQYLKEKLQTNFELLVDTMLPRINNEISAKIQELDQKIEDSKEETKLDDLCKTFAKTLKHVLKEKHIKQDNFYAYNHDKNFMFEFKEALEVKTSSIVFDKKTLEEIQHSNSIFISDNLFKNIVDSYFDSYRINTILSFDKVKNVIINHMDSIATNKYTGLTAKIKKLLKEFLNARSKALNKYYIDFLGIHTSCINTSHPDFNKRKILQNVLCKYIKSKKDDTNSKYFGVFNTSNHTVDINDKFDVDLIYQFTHTYFECNKKFMADHAMKAVFFYLIENFVKDCANFLREHKEDIKMVYDQENNAINEVNNILITEKEAYQNLYDVLND